MSLQLPDLNKVASGLTSFPPKLSSLIEPLASFEQQASSSLPLPKPGPAASLEQMAQQFESSMGSANFALPALPQLPFAQPTQASQTVAQQTVAQPMVPSSPLAQAPAAVQPIMPTGSKFQVL
jgi:hypothetical protein